MRKLVALFVIFAMSTAVAANGANGANAKAPEVKDVVSKGLCEYWGKDVDVPGDSALSDLAEAGLTVVEIGAESVICTAEGAAYLSYKYGLKPLGKVGKEVMCGIGKGLTKFFETFFGPSNNGSGDECIVTHDYPEGPEGK